MGLNQTELLAIMGDKKSKPNVEEFQYHKYILQKGLASKELRNEIYAQLMKQLTDNPSTYAQVCNFL
jgi:hypothetical protein